MRWPKLAMVCLRDLETQLVFVGIFQADKQMHLE